MAHTLPPAQCAANVASFTNPTLSSAVKVRKAHIDELRTEVAAELSRRGLSAAPEYTDPTIYPRSSPSKTKIRKMHVTELRTQIDAIQSGRSEAGYCSEDAVSISWTDTPGPGVKIKHAHFTEMRTAINDLKSACICETEQCAFCSDCGYYYSQAYCNCQKGCYCDGSKYSGGCSDTGTNYYYLCGSIDAGGEHPKKSWDGSTSVPWDGTVY